MSFNRKLRGTAEVTLPPSQHQKFQYMHWTAYLASSSIMEQGLNQLGYDGWQVIHRKGKGKDRVEFLMCRSYYGDNWAKPPHTSDSEMEQLEERQREQYRERQAAYEKAKRPLREARERLSELETQLRSAQNEQAETLTARFPLGGLDPLIATTKDSDIQRLKQAIKDLKAAIKTQKRKVGGLERVWAVQRDHWDRLLGRK